MAALNSPCRARNPLTCIRHHPELKTLTVKELETRYGKPSMRRSLALTTNLNINAANDLTQDTDPKVLENLALNENLPMNVFNDLANINDEDINLNLSRNPNTPANILINLYNPTRKDSEIKFYIAKHSNTPETILKAIVSEGNTDLMVGVASNPAASASLLNHIMMQPNGTNDLWGLVAANPNCSNEALEHILEVSKKDSLGWMASSMARNPNISGDLLHRIVVGNNNSIVLTTAASNPNTRTETLNLILDKENDYVAAAKIANNFNIDDDLCKRLLKEYERYSDVAGNLARNPKTSETILFDLFLHNDKTVRTNAYYNPNADEDIRIAAGLAGGINHNDEREAAYWRAKGKVKPEDYAY